MVDLAMATPPSADVDEYPARIRAALVFLRAIIRDGAPQLEEQIKYVIPTYKFHWVRRCLG